MRTRKRPKDMYDPSPGNMELEWVSECVLKGFPTTGHYPKVSLGLLRMSTTGWICGWVDDMAHLFMSNKAKTLVYSIICNLETKWNSFPIPNSQTQDSPFLDKYTDPCLNFSACSIHFSHHRPAELFMASGLSILVCASE